MLSSLMKSVLPNRFLFPQRRRFRDRPAMMVRSEVSVVRLLSFLFGGILLANLVLMASATFGGRKEEPGATARGPAAAVAAEQSRTAAAATDGRSVPESEVAADAETERLPDPVITMIDRACAEHAREKLMVGLTNYYLQRRLRPGASSDDAADTSSATMLLAGPGDPAATTSDGSCRG
jgi:hypothetical protein